MAGLSHSETGLWASGSQVSPPEKGGRRLGCLLEVVNETVSSFFKNPSVVLLAKYNTKGKTKSKVSQLFFLTPVFLSDLSSILPANPVSYICFAASTAPLGSKPPPFL